MYLESLKTITSKLTIYYDGQCPLCLAEIHFLKHHNHKKLLDFVSLQELTTSTSEINCELALKSIHARLGDKQIIVGADVFFEAYKRTDLRMMSYLFSFTVFRFLYAKFYTFFAKHRQQISKAVGPLMLSLVQRKYPHDIK
jgi:predicted DCC family thiol-disulfide oxidoreductase YuxK